MVYYGNIRKINMPSQSNNRQALSANSKNIKSFLFKQKFYRFASLFILPGAIVIGLFVYVTLRYDLVSHLPIQSQTSQLVELREGGQAATDSSNGAVVTQGTTPGTSGAVKSNGQPMTQAELEKLYGPKPVAIPAPTPSYSKTIPDTIPAILDSIEKTGVKNNPNVAMDTSSIPDGTTVVFDRTSWINITDTTSSISGTVSALGQKRTGYLTFTQTNNIWKVTGYSINY